MLKKFMCTFVAVLSVLAPPKAPAQSHISGFYWIDDSPTVTEFNSSQFDIPTEGLRDGFHTLNIVATGPGEVWSTPHSRNFIKMPESGNGWNLNAIAILDGNHTDNIILTNTGADSYFFDLDCSEVAYGFHNLQIIVSSPGGSISTTMDTWFFRRPTDADMNEAKLVYYIDGNFAGIASCKRSSDIFMLDIDMNDSKTGIHSIDMLVSLPKAGATEIVSSWFYKMPVPPGVSKYSYWFNNDIADIKTHEVSSPTEEFNITGMIEIPQLPFNSKQYVFSIDNDKPIISNVQNLSMQFYESDGRSVVKQTEFVDSRSARVIEDIKRLEEGSNSVSYKSVSAIDWYSFEGETGDSIALRGGCQMMIELYSPSGKTLLQNKGAKAEVITSHTLAETGTYYLAVHEVTSKKGSTVDFYHIPRNAILEVTPSKTAATNTVTLVELFGNGMTGAQKMTLIGDNGICYEVDTIAAKDNYHLTAILKHDEPLALGAYDVTLIIHDEITNSDVSITKTDCINVVEKLDAANMEVRVVPSRKPSTPYMVDIYVTNNSDTPCWGVPFNLACERDGGSNGFKIWFEDLLQCKPMLTDLNWYETDNLLGTGTDGIIFNPLINYFQPHETRLVRVGITSEPHKKVGLYAWCGEPYSEELERLKSLSVDSLANMTLTQSNNLSLFSIMYMMELYEELLEESEESDQPANLPSIRRALKDDVTGEIIDIAEDEILERMEKLHPDAVGIYKKMKKPANMAGKVVDIAVADALVIACIVNSAGLNQSHEGLSQEGYRGMTLPEQMRMIQEQYGTDVATYPDGIKTHYIQAQIYLSRLMSPSDILRKAYGDEVGDIIDIMTGRCASAPTPEQTRIDIYCLQSNDPNMMTGYTDPTGGNFVGVNVKSLDYVIEFENDSVQASASACEVVIRNTLDKSIFNLSTFKARNITIGSHTIELPEMQEFVITYDMRPQIQCLLEIRQQYSALTGEIVWTLRSLDPITVDPVSDHRQGFLPINDSSGVGIGFITYSVGLNANLDNREIIRNKASIVFDDNAAIETPEWINVTDYEYPTAWINREYAYSNGAYAFDIEATDSDSGIHSYTLYARLNDGDDWIAIMPNQTDSHIDFATDEPIEGIRFMVLATDCAGNVQTKPIIPLMGDTDNSGFIDANDVVIIRNYYTDLTHEINKQNADINLDGMIDAQDAILTRNIYLHSK